MHHSKQQAFTIVELLIVIVVIAILAAISVVVFGGIRQRATDASLQSDIITANKQLKLYYAEYDTYPTANSCPTPGATEICLATSPGNSLNYTPSLTASPPTYSLTATSGSSYAVSINGSSPQKAYGTRVVTLTNMLVNSDFSNGLTGWTNYCLGATACTIDHGQLVVTTDGVMRVWILQQTNSSYTDGDKVLYSVLLRRDSGSSFSMRADRNSGGYSHIIMDEAQFGILPAGSFIRQSDIRTFDASHGEQTSLRFGSSVVPENGYHATIDNALAINLTAAFGAGNEPTASQMNAILEQFPNGYFTGTVNATY